MPDSSSVHHLEVMRWLLRRGTDPDAQDNCFGPLTYSASGLGQAKVVRSLLQHSADVNAGARYNYTPLHWASMNGHANVAQVFLDHGAGFNAQSDFGTPLYLATTSDHLEAARLLLARGADVHIRVPRGLTPFQTSGESQISQLLLEHGAEHQEKPPLIICYNLHLLLNFTENYCYFRLFYPQIIYF